MTTGIGIYKLLIYIVSIVYIHYRGQVRYCLIQQKMTHTNLIAADNAFAYATSLIPNLPVLEVDDFPDLTGLYSTSIPDLDKL